MSARASAKFVAEITDWPRVVGEIIQQTFFPHPPTRWETMAPHQQEEFRECAVEIMDELRRRGWRPPEGWRPEAKEQP